MRISANIEQIGCAYGALVDGIFTFERSFNCYSNGTLVVEVVRDVTVVDDGTSEMKNESIDDIKRRKRTTGKCYLVLWAVAIVILPKQDELSSYFLPRRRNYNRHLCRKRG